jgi:5-methylcytosine-specific restriction endonuclease McrA
MSLSTHRKPPATAPDKPAPARYSRQKRSANGKDRGNRDKEYDVISDILKEQNPLCYYCGYEFAPTQLQSDHIAAGTGGRAKSLLNFETQNNTCPECHIERPVWEKIAAKLTNVIRAIRRMRGKCLTVEEDRKVLKRVKAALAEPRAMEERI